MDDKLIAKGKEEDVIIIEDTDEECSDTSDDIVCYHHGDKSIPVYSSTTHYSYSEAVNILLATENNKICTKHPTLVEDNLSFVIDLSKLAHIDDIKSDDCGHWVHNGKKTTKVAVWKQGIQITKVVSVKTSSPPDENSQLYTLVRVYYVHDPHEDFKRTYYYLFDNRRICHNLCLVCYSFDDKPHSVNPRPHGNSKSGIKYVRTMKSTTEKMSSSSSSSLKETMTEVINDAGGMINSRCAGALPKSHQQVSYYKCKEKSQKELGHNFDVLYNVMLQCKTSNPGKEFVRAVAAAPEPMAVLATNHQLDDMVRFLTDPVDFSIMGVDPTFNFGDFNVTPTVYCNLLLEHCTRGHCPVMLGPMLVHHQKKFSSYNFFASTLISLRPALRNIIAFGTDGETELYKAFAVNFPYALHLRCFRHYRGNLSSKLKDLGIPTTVTEMFLSEIFGRSEDQIHTEGIVDANSSQNFRQRLEALQDVWDSREQECNPGKEPSFFNWFVANKCEEMVDNMLRPICEAAGLGCPPSPYYTNDSESINSVMHTKTHYKASEWDKFNIAMQELVEQSNQLLELAVIDKGSARFRCMYKELVVDHLQWMRMTPKQRELHLRKVATVKVVGSLTNSTVESDITDTDDYSSLSLSPEEANIATLPIETVHGIWCKAQELLKTPGAVVNGPCFSASVNSTVIVASKSSAKPHVITCKPQGVISCESSCPNWASLQICSHSVAAAQFNCELDIFVDKYRKKKLAPNLMKLAKVGMPKGAGKKGDLPPKKKKCPQTISKNVAPSTPLTQSQSRDKTNSLACQDTSQTVTVTGHDFSNHTQYTSLSYLPQGFHSPVGLQGFQSTQVRYPTMQFPPTYHYQGTAYAISPLFTITSICSEVCCWEYQDMSVLLIKSP